MNDQQLMDMLAQINKQLVFITMHLQTLATVAAHQHPEAFKDKKDYAQVRRP